MKKLESLRKNGKEEPKTQETKSKLKPKFKEKVQHQGVKSLNLTKMQEKTKFANVSQEIEFLL